MPSPTEDNHAAIEAGLAAVAEWEAEHGPLSAEELAAADAVLDAAGVGVAPDVSANQRRRR